MKRSDVQHMKWWGWGIEGNSYHWEDKPKLPPFVMRVLGIDITKGAFTAPKFADMNVPASILEDDLKAALVSAIGEDNVCVDDMDRVVHAFGKGIRDLIRVRKGKLRRVPDVVVYPADQEQVQAIVKLVVAANGVLIPFGGGSNIVAALEAVPDEKRVVVSVDLGRMNKVLKIDEKSSMALIQCGVLGPDMEAQLGPRGWTMGHFPDSFTHSTLGGWIATRSTGMQSDKYGDIADIVRGMTMVTPEGELLELHPLPSTSSGPSVREMILGSEGRLGIITQAWVNVHKVPEVREIQAYFFRKYADGIECMREIMESDAAPTVTRVSDEAETAFTFATQKKSRGLSKLLTRLFQKNLQRQGWDLDNFCLSFIGYEGSAAHVKYEKKLVAELVKKWGGVGVGKGPGALYDQKKFDIPYIRDFLLDYGAAADVSETASPWATMVTLHDETVKRVYAAMDEIGCRGYIMCHLSHSYHGGACQYFTFAINDPSEAVERNYDVIKQAIQTSFVDHEATVSHHHGVGEEHSPWMARDISAEGVRMQQALFTSFDPGQNFNPGKIVHTGEPGISTNAVEAKQ